MGNRVASRGQLLDEIARLHRRVGALEYLGALGRALGKSRSPEEALGGAGRALHGALCAVAAGEVVLEYGERQWRFGEADREGCVLYERPLVWGGRQRGRLRLFCPRPLEAPQEELWLDRSAEQLAQALEARQGQVRALHTARLLSLEEVAAGLAHELSQPLMAISTTAEDLYLRELEGLELGAGQLREMMQDVLAMVERLERVVEHLRAFSPAGFAAPPVRFALNELVDSVLHLVGAQLKNHGIELRLELGEALPAVQGRPQQLELALLDLLSRARAALDRKGAGEEKWLRLETRRAGVQKVLVEIADNAAMDETERERLFEPFFSAGPDLSALRVLAAEHGGCIRCRSRPGGGAVFQLELAAAGAD